MVKSGKAMSVVLVRLSLGGSVKAKQASPPERDLEQEPRKIRLWNGAPYRRPGAETQAEPGAGLAESAVPAESQDRIHALAGKSSGPAPLVVILSHALIMAGQGSIRARGSNSD